MPTAWSVLDWSQVTINISDLALTLQHCLNEAELAGATVTLGLPSCAVETSSQVYHHGATAVANPDYQTSSPRASTLNSGLKRILKTKEREKNLLNASSVRMSFVFGNKLEVIPDFAEKHF